MRLASAVLACALAATGCYKTTIINDTVPPGGREESETQVYFLWGLIGDPEVDTWQMCGSDVREIRHRAPPLGVLVRVVTLGIVSMREVEVECAGKVRTARATRGEVGVQ